MKAKILILGLLFCSQISSQNRSVQFDGVDDQILTNKWFNGTSSSFTFEAWIKPDTSQCNQCAFINHEANANAVVFEFLYAGVGQPVRLHGQIYKPGNYTQYNVYHNLNPDGSTWYHVALSYNADSLILYVDGSQVDHVLGNDVIDWNANFTQDNLGLRLSSAGPLYPYKGHMDEVRVWSVERTQAQIMAYNDSCLKGTETGLRAYYRLNEGVDTLTYSSCAADTGRLRKGPVWSTDAPTIYSPLSSTATHDICDGDSLYAEGAYRKVAGTYYDSLYSICNCDSIHETILNVTSLKTSVTVSGATITSDEMNATGYQWIECPSNNALHQDTLQSFTAVKSGSYAVIVEKDGCTDTSECVTIEIVGIEKSMMSNNEMSFYPNPVSSVLHVELKEGGNFNLQLMNLQGQVVRETSSEGSFDWNLDDVENGVYMIRACRQGGDCVQQRIIKLE